MGNVKKGRGLCKNCYCSIKGQPHRQMHRTNGGRNGLTSLGITWLTGDCQWLMDAPFVVTRSPTDAWTAQQLREATSYGHTPKYLIRDNESKFGPCFARVAATSGIKILKTPYHAPRANAICERFMGSVRRECLDHLFILQEKQLQRVLHAYIQYFNQARPQEAHQATDSRTVWGACSSRSPER